MTHPRWIRQIMCVGGVLGMLLVLLACPIAQGDAPSMEAEPEASPLFMLSIEKLAFTAQSPLAPVLAKRMKHHYGAAEVSMILRRKADVFLIKATPLPWATLETDPPAPARLRLPFAKPSYLHYWAAAGGKEDHQSLDHVELKQHWVVGFGGIQEIRNIKMMWEITYATGQPRQLRLEPVEAYLDKWIGLEEVPGLRLRVTRKPLNTRSEFYNFELSSEHQQHVAGLHFLDRQGKPVFISGRRGHYASEVDHSRPFQNVSIQAAKDATQAIIVDVYPTLQKGVAKAHYQRVPLLRAVTAEDSPGVMIELGD